MAYLFKQSKQVEDLYPYIQQNNDLYAGRRQLLLNMDIYYDGLELDTADKKAARWKRTPFYLYYPKIISSFTSSIYKKPPHYEIPVEDEEVENIDLLGNSLDEYTAQIPQEVLKQGFCATIIDYSDSLNKPFFTLIKPEWFVSFQTRNTKGYPELSQFIYSLWEEITDPEDEFSLKNIKVHYVWDFDENGQVRVRKYQRQRVEEDQTLLHRKRDKSEYSDNLVKTTKITKNGKPLDTLPIIIHGKESNNYTIEKSVLQDVSDLNINLINRVVDQIEVLHLTALPTPYIIGADPEDENLPTTIGSSKLWVLSDAESSVGMLEFDGKSAQAHRDYIEDLKEVMATEGAQILRKGGVSRETATSVLIRTGQETAIITSIVKNISSQVTEALKIYFDWIKKPTSKVMYKLNSDFLSVDMEPNAQIALVRSWLDGAISHRTVFNKLKEGEIIEANKTFETELEEIQENPPPFPAKEKDAEIAEEAAEQQQKNAQELANQEQQDRSMKGSNMETGNEVKNTEVTN